MKKDYILFDLDGTLTDPRVGITRAVQYSLRAFGIDVADADELIPFIGPPLWDSYGKFYGFDADQTKRAVAAYREYFAERGIFENTLYPGVDEMLRRLRDTGRTLVLATSKPAVYADRILTHFELDTYFAFVSGSELDGRRSAKSEVIRYAMDNMKITDPAAAVMVGDREHDIIGAKAVGMDSAGVLYGYGSRGELEAAGADYIAADVAESGELLAGL